MPPAKPHWFKWRDLLFPGSLALVAWPLSIWVLLAENVRSGKPGAELPTGVLGYQGLMVVVALAMTGIYGWLLWRRHAELAPFVYIKGPYYAVMLHPGRYQGDRSHEAVTREFQRAFERWSKVFDQRDIWRMASSSVFWLWLKPNNLVDRWDPGKKVAGHTISRSRKMVIAYTMSTDPLSLTSLEHELGHVIQGELTGDWSEGAHHSRASSFSAR